MTRKLFLCFITLLLCAGFASAQKQALPKLTLKTYHPIPKASGNAAINQAGTGLPLFTYTVKSSRDHNTYSGAIVGNRPFKNGGGTVTVKTQIVPVVIVTERVATSLSPSGIFTTAPGVRTSDPTKNDNSCLAAPNNNPVRLVQQSPIFRPTNFSFGGTNVGDTQYIDAFQRAEFWDVINRGTYHVKLAPTTLAPVVVHVPAASGLTAPKSIFGTCGPFGFVDINFFDALLDNVILPSLASKGVNPGTFPIFQLYNVALTAGDPRDLNNCCFGGYHSISVNFQTYSPSLFDTTGLFGPDATDTAILAHEVGEWANDPSGFNPTPAWGHTGQVGGCQNNLEVGDPLTGNDIPPVKMPNGFTYNLQELAFFSWFFGAPTIGLNGWFSDNGTFLRDAGPPCTN
jgi:hypothetical protein